MSDLDLIVTNATDQLELVSGSSSSSRGQKNLHE